MQSRRSIRGKIGGGTAYPGVRGIGDRIGAVAGAAIAGTVQASPCNKKSKALSGNQNRTVTGCRKKAQAACLRLGSRPLQSSRLRFHGISASTSPADFTCGSRLITVTRYRYGSIPFARLVKTRLYSTALA